mgnify:CR=1 FL=1
MEKKNLVHTVKYDGNIVDIFECQPSGKAKDNTLSWDLITKGATLVVRPVQIPRNSKPFGVPTEINSVLRAASWIIYFAHESRRTNNEVMALYEINIFIEEITGNKLVSVPKPRRNNSYTAKERTKITKLLTDTKNAGVSKLKAIQAFILENVKSRIIQDAYLRKLVQFIGKQLGRNDIILRTIIAYNSKMPEMFKSWTTEASKFCKVPQAKARQFLAENITFIAEFKGQRFLRYYPVEDIANKPKHVQESPEAMNHFQYDFVNVDRSEWRKGGPHMLSRTQLARELHDKPKNSSFKKLLAIHPERRFYPTKQIDAVNKALKDKRRSPCAARYDATDWIDKWKPRKTLNWGHPGHKSIPSLKNQG